MLINIDYKFTQNAILKSSWINGEYQIGRIRVSGCNRACISPLAFQLLYVDLLHHKEKIFIIGIY